MIGQSNWSLKHTIYFEAAETDHRYVNRTHGCNKNSKCIAAYEKGNVNEKQYNIVNIFVNKIFFQDTKRNAMEKYPCSP